MSMPRETVIESRQDQLHRLTAIAQPDPDMPLVEGSGAIQPWYVVHTKIRQEQTACENLTRQGYNVYLPRIKILKRSRGRQQAQYEPLFPRYIFLQPCSVAHSISPVRSTLGVSTIVRFGQEPAVMRPETLKSIRDFEAHRNDAPDEEISPFQPGVRIRVADGPLTGLEGLISGVSQQRVIVLMQLLGQDTRVSLSYHQLLVAH
jgi:transcriptional antiterminator RfaH